MNANVFDSRLLAVPSFPPHGSLAVEMLELLGRLRPLACQDQLHESAVVFAVRLELALYADYALAGGLNGRIYRHKHKDT